MHIIPKLAKRRPRKWKHSLRDHKDMKSPMMRRITWH